MKAVIVLALCVTAACRLAAAPRAADADSLGAGPTLLDPKVPQVVYVAFGRSTVIQLVGNKHAPTVTVGANIIEYEYDPKLNQIRIFPAVQDGETNFTMTIDRKTYVTIIKVVHDKRVEYVRTFTIQNEGGDQQDAGDEEVLSHARPMKPVEIDLVHYAETAERAKMDAVFRGTLTNYRYSPIRKAYSWNDNQIWLLEVHQFLDKDLLLFKVEWVNHGPLAYYLNARQYGLAVANQPIRVLLAMQDAPQSLIFPGQYEEVWLAVQGYRLRRENDWRLILPPDARAVTTQLLH